MPAKLIECVINAKQARAIGQTRKPNWADRLDHPKPFDQDTPVE